MFGATQTQHQRVMMYSQDGFGLGHMRRTTLIAREILAMRPDATVLTLTDSRLGQFFEASEHHDYLKLPSILKVSAGVWRGVSLPIPFPEILAMRAQIIHSAAMSFQPHVLLVDHMPHGAMGELLPTLDALRSSSADTRIVLGMRDILDAPETISRVWKAEGAYDAIERYYDKVLVYGQQDVFDSAAQYGFPPAIAQRLQYTGYVCTPEPARYVGRARSKYLTGTPADTKLLVAMAGGGADAYPMMKALLAALPAIQAEQRCVLVLITGPFMPREQRRQLEYRARTTPSAYVTMTVSDTLSYISAADLVFSMCGYNTTMEILRTSTPAVLIPRAGPSAEQRTRARLFAERGWLRMVDPDDLSTSAIVDATISGLNEPPASRQRPDGLTAAAGALGVMLDDRTALQRAAA